MRRHLSVAVAMACGLPNLGAAALAAPVLHFESAHDSMPPPALGATGRPEGKTAPYRVPEGLPGFYEPATRNFEPLILEPQAAPKTYSGTVTVAIHISGEKGIGPDDTVFCDLTVLFGNVAGSPPQYFTNHSVRVSTNFAAGEPSVDLSAPFDYTPNGNGKLRLQLACRIPFASDGNYHSATTTLPVQPLANGNINASFPLSM